MVSQADYDRITKSLIPEVEGFIKSLSSNSQHDYDSKRITLLQEVLNLANGAGLYVGESKWGALPF
jgi:hypothetical protein